MYSSQSYCISFFYLQIKPFYMEDVYKRQLFERQNKKVIHRTAGYLQISMGNHKVTMFPQNSADSHIHVYPVSYTHLDVYQRQQYAQHQIMVLSIDTFSPLFENVPDLSLIHI